MSNGKGDMRGKPITVLSQEARDNWDRIFSTKGRKTKTTTDKKKEDNNGYTTETDRHSGNAPADSAAS